MPSNRLLVFASVLAGAACATQSPPHNVDFLALDEELLSTFPSALSGASALGVDAQIIAAAEGWTVSDTEDHLGDASVFDDLVADVRAGYGSFADVRFADLPGGSSTIWFKGAVPSGVDGLVTASGLSVTLVGGFAMSHNEMQTRSDAIVDELLAQGYTDFSVAFVGDSSFEVAIGSGQGPISLPDPISTGVTVTYSAAATSGFYVTCGGAETETATGRRQCTAGFTVEHSDSTLGVSSAAHCTLLGNPTSRLDNENGSSKDTLSLEDRHAGAHGDLEWYTSSGSVRAEFWADLDRIFSQESRARAYSRNSHYCEFGRTTGVRVCSRIYRTSVAMNNQGLTPRRLIAMDVVLGSAGDSGGPVSRGTRAGGLITGFTTINGTPRETISKVSRLDNALDVRVYIP